MVKFRHSYENKGIQTNQVEVKISPLTIRMCLNLTQSKKKTPKTNHRTMCSFSLLIQKKVYTLFCAPSLFLSHFLFPSLFLLLC